MSKKYDFLVYAKRVALDDIPDCEGAYLLAAGRSAIYAGQTSSVRRRIAEHRWTSHIPALKALIKDESLTKALFIFDQAACERATGLSGRAARRAVESMLVIQAEPSLNERKASAAYVKIQFDHQVLLSGATCVIGAWRSRVANRGMV